MPPVRIEPATLGAKPILTEISHFWWGHFHNLTTASGRKQRFIPSVSRLGLIWTQLLKQNPNENKNSTEWNWEKVWYKTGETESQLRNNELISTLNIYLQNRRYKPFVDLTLYTPIYVLMILLPLGVLIPGKNFIMYSLEHFFSVQSGEKMGFQITLLLATFFYVSYFQENMPTFSG